MGVDYNSHASSLCQQVMVLHCTNIVISRDITPLGPRFRGPRFRDRISFPRYRKLTLFYPDLVDKNHSPEGVPKSGSDYGINPYSVSSLSCGVHYPGYINDKHPSRHEGTVNTKVCFSTSLSNEGQSCQTARMVNCGSYYLYQMKPTSSYYYGFCVAQDQCSDAVKLHERWRLIINPYVSGQSSAADNKLKKGWYRMSLGHGTMPTYEPDEYYGGNWGEGGDISWGGDWRGRGRGETSDPDLVPPDLVAPRFSDTINFPRNRKLTLFDPDLAQINLFKLVLKSLKLLKQFQTF
eukprot:sb/3467540/